MHQTKYRGIITEGRIIDVSSLGAGLLGEYPKVCVNLQTDVR